jgi:hypothetical protein
LKPRGAVAAEEHSLRVLLQRQDMTGADRARANHYETSDVRCARGSKSMRVKAVPTARVVLTTRGLK